MKRNLWQELKDAAAKSQISLSDEIRNRLINYSELLKENAFYKSIRESLSSEVRPDQDNSKLYPLIVENNLILRKLARYMNSQIIIETDQQLPQYLKNKGT